jgi:hypothetical protein
VCWQSAHPVLRIKLNSYYGGGCAVDEEGWQAMSEDPVRVEKLLNDYAVAKTKLQRLQNVADGHARVLDRVVELLKHGDASGARIALGVEPYLSGPLTQLLRELLDACDERDELKESLSDLGVNVED